MLEVFTNPPFHTCHLGGLSLRKDGDVTPWSSLRNGIPRGITWFCKRSIRLQILEDFLLSMLIFRQATPFRIENCDICNTYLAITWPWATPAGVESESSAFTFYKMCTTHLHFTGSHNSNTSAPIPHFCLVVPLGEPSLLWSTWSNMLQLIGKIPKPHDFAGMQPLQI